MSSLTLRHHDITLTFMPLRRQRSDVARKRWLALLNRRKVKKAWRNYFNRS